MPTEEINILNIDVEPSQPEGFDVQLDLQQPNSPALSLGVVLPIGEGGAIKSISRNGVQLPIIEGNVDITVPTSTSELVNDSGFITSAAITGKVDRTELAQVAFTGDYDDLEDKPEIPSLDGYATETYVGNAVSAHNESTTAHTDIRNEISGINELIPAQAATDNQLADKAFVNSSIATETATFRGTYNEVADLGLTTAATHSDIAAALVNVISVADSNDYSFVQIPTSDATPTEIESIERYKFVTGTGWQYEYSLNNSGFTAAQWAAINSGITTGLVTQIGTNASDILTIQGAIATLTTGLSGKVSKSGDTMTGDLTVDNSAVVIKVSGTQMWRLKNNTTHLEISYSTNGGTSWGVRSRWYATQDRFYFNYNNVYAGNVTDENYRLQRYSEIYTTGIVSDTKTWSEQADGSYSYVASNTVSGPIPNSFITEWNVKCSLYSYQGAGKFNTTTGYFEANGLTDITYEEAIIILYESSMPSMQQTNYRRSRTNLGVAMNSASFARQWQNSNNEIAYGANTSWNLSASSSTTTVFNPCQRLREIIYWRFSYIQGTFAPGGTSENNNLPSLQIIRVSGSTYGPVGNIDLRPAPNFTLEGVQELVNKAPGNNSITFRFHTNVRNMCQADTTEYTYNGQTYTGIIAYAAAKNITIQN